MLPTTTTPKPRPGRAQTPARRAQARSRSLWIVAQQTRRTRLAARVALLLLALGINPPHQAIQRSPIPFFVSGLYIISPARIASAAAPARLLALANRGAASPPAFSIILDCPQPADWRTFYLVAHRSALFFVILPIFTASSRTSPRQHHPRRSVSGTGKRSYAVTGPARHDEIADDVVRL